jgi:hypothetical protein
LTFSRKCAGNLMPARGNEQRGEYRIREGFYASYAVVGNAIAVVEDDREDRKGMLRVFSSRRQRLTSRISQIGLLDEHGIRTVPGVPILNRRWGW